MATGEKVKIGGDKSQVTMVATALLLCPEHQHNFAVVNTEGGRSLIAQQEDVDCLRANGVVI